MAVRRGSTTTKPGAKAKPAGAKARTPSAKASEPSTSASEPSTNASPACAECEALREELLSEREEHQRALERLGRTGEELDALRLALSPEAALLPHERAAIARAGWPLRYQLADRANGLLKRVASPLHTLLRRTLGRLRGARR